MHLTYQWTQSLNSEPLLTFHSLLFMSKIKSIQYIINISQSNFKCPIAHVSVSYPLEHHHYYKQYLPITICSIFMILLSSDAEEDISLVTFVNFWIHFLAVL